MSNHLIHIGYPKAGSTFLQRWFSLHSQLRFADGGILGFRNVRQIAEEGGRPAGDLRYRVTSCENLSTALFPESEWGSHLATGSLESMGEAKRRAEKKICADLAELFPDATILLVTRGFRSFLLSAYSQHVREGGTSDIASAAASLRATPTVSHVACNYDELINSYSGAFDERIIVVPYEMLRDDAVAFVKLLESKLGLKHCPPPTERINPSLSPVELSWYPRMARAIQRLPLGTSTRGMLGQRFTRAINSGRLTPLVAALQKIRPLPLVTTDSYDTALIEKFRGCADSLRLNPLFAPYAADYLF